LTTAAAYHVTIPPVARAVSQGFLVTGFLPLGAPGAYIHATDSVRSTLHTIHVLPTRPLHAPLHVRLPVSTPTPLPGCLRRAPPFIVTQAGTDAGDAIRTALIMWQSHMSLSCQQQLHASGSFLSARWLIGQAKSPLGVAAEWDMLCPLDIGHSCWASLPPSPHPNNALGAQYCA
jgi:hypothetical protein